MRRLPSLPVLLAMLAVMLLTVSAGARADTPATQSIRVEDSRVGMGPCGFEVRRTIAGTINVTPGIDANGGLVLSIDDVYLHGSLANLANGKSLELKWVKQDGTTMLWMDGSVANVNMGLIGRVLLDYDSVVNGNYGAGSDLVDLRLSADGTPIDLSGLNGSALKALDGICALLA